LFLALTLKTEELWCIIGQGKSHPRIGNEGPEWQ